MMLIHLQVYSTMAVVFSLASTTLKSLYNVLTLQDVVVGLPLKRGTIRYNQLLAWSLYKMSHGVGVQLFFN